MRINSIMKNIIQIHVTKKMQYNIISKITIKSSN